MELTYNQWPRFTEWVLRNRLLESEFVLIDVGVQGGIHPRWNALGPSLKVYGFDPLEEVIAPLTSLNLANHQYRAIAIGDADGERDLFVPAAVLPASSFFPRETEQDQARMAIDASNWKGVQTRRVPMRRLDTLMAEEAIPRADFLKIDCEGFEPAVLQGAGRFLAQSGILAIESEIGFSSIHWPQTHFLAVYERLLPHGFRLADLAFNRVTFASFIERASALGRIPTATVSLPGTFQMLFVRSLTIAARNPTVDEVLKARSSSSSMGCSTLPTICCRCSPAYSHRPSRFRRAPTRSSRHHRHDRTEDRVRQPAHSSERHGTIGGDLLCRDGLAAGDAPSGNSTAPMAGVRRDSDTTPCSGLNPAPRVSSADEGTGGCILPLRALAMRVVVMPE
jgi:FkbM family methyltransferase